MTVVLAIDPGPVESAWIVFDSEASEIRSFAKSGNDWLLDQLRNLSPDVRIVAVEKIESFGMAVGAEIFETVWWSGRFAEAVLRPAIGVRGVVQVPRRTVKLHLCGSAKAKDANIRQALIDRFGGSAAKGTKAKPGPLYGIAKDVWSALAIAVTYTDQMA